MANKMIQVGIVALRGPDGRVVKDAPLYLPVAENDHTEEKAMTDFARVAARRMHEAMIRERRARRKQANA